MFNLLFSSLLWASPLGESETSYAGATILEGNIDVAFDHITNIEYETDSRAYAFFEEV